MLDITKYERHGLFLIVILTVIYFFHLTTSFRLPPNYNYDSDLGRDLLTIYEINQGKMTLIGPRLNLSGLHMSSYYYYLFAPFFRMGNYDHRFVFFANAFIFVAGFSYLYFLLHKGNNRTFTLLSLLWVATSPYMILAARSPGNAFSYLPFLGLYLFVVFAHAKIARLDSFLLGLFGGIIVNFHPVAVGIIPVLFLAKILLSKYNSFRTKLFTLAFHILGFVSSFLPLFIFDLRHNFLTLKLLIDKNSYADFFPMQQMFSPSDFIPKFLGLFQHTNELVHGGIIGLFTLVTILVFLKRGDRMMILGYILSSINIILLMLSAKGVLHYYFPAILLLQTLFIHNLRNTKPAVYILGLLLFLNLVFWPSRFYLPARNLEEIEGKFQVVLSSGNLPKESLNVVLNNQTHISKVGYEYRYLLVKNKFKILDEYSYKDSKYLLLVSERGEVDWSKEGGWEWAQFGDKKLLWFLQLDDNYNYYLFEKV